VADDQPDGSPARLVEGRWVRPLDGEEHDDLVAVEEPLELRIEGRPVAVTLRTPGHDRELAAGFLLTEGVIEDWDDVRALAHVDDPAAPQGNTVDVVLSAGVPAARRERAVRELYASSSCGVCGKASIDRLFQRFAPLPPWAAPEPAVILSLPGRMRALQVGFAACGALHAAALFSPDGQLEVLREDVGRHNAVDKVIGWRLLQDRMPIDDRILVVSSRIGFEIVQKALIARIPMLVAVGAPTTMAIDLAQRGGLLLAGFLRDGRFNRY
jgi:FdhD protein